MSSHHYFIDGYNLLFKIPGKFRSLEAKRRSLLKFLEAKISQKKLHATIVFDGAQKDPLESSYSHFKNLEVVYTAANQSADEFIVAAVSQSSAREKVITSDRELAMRCQLLKAETEDIPTFLAFLVKPSKQSRKEKTPLQESPSQIARYLRIFEELLKDSNYE